MSEFSKNAKKIGTNIKNCRLKLNITQKELADFRKAVKSKEDSKYGILLMPDCQRHCAICGKPIENTEGIKREGRDLNNYRIDYEALHCSHCGTFIGFKYKLSDRKALNYFKSIVKWAIKNT